MRNLTVVGVCAGALLGLVGAYTYLIPGDGPVRCTLFAHDPKTKDVERMMFPAASVDAGLKRGHQEAADWWAKHPGLGFQLFCVDITDNNPEELWKKALEGMRDQPHGETAPADPGHGALRWEQPG